MDLLERTAETARLRAASVSAVAGSGRVVVVRGTPGVGKTALLDRAASEAADIGLQVLRATGTEIGRSQAYGSVLDLLERHVHRADPAERDRLLTGAAAPAATILQPEAEMRTADTAAQQMLLARALRWVFANVAEQGPLAVVVDDLHWVDEPSLRALIHLAHRAADLPLVLAVGTRPVDEPLVDLLLQVPGVRCLDVGPLGEQSTRKLLSAVFGAPVGRAFAAASYAATGGNPLLTSRLAAELRDEGSRGEDVDVDLIASVGTEPVFRHVHASLRQMPPPARALADALAVLDHADIGLAADLARVAPGEARDAVAPMQRAGLIRGDVELRLAHPLVRQSLVQALPPALRAIMDRDAARLLHARAEPHRAAAHLLRSPSAGEAWAVDALLAAADAASRRSEPRYAGGLLERASTEPPPPELLPTVLIRLARVRSGTADARAAETYEAAVAAADAAARPAILLELAWEHQHRGRFTEAAAACREALEHAAADDPIRAELETMRDAAALWSAELRPDADAGPPPDELRRLVPSRPFERALLADHARRMMFSGIDHAGAADLARRAWGRGTFLRATTSDDPVATRIFTVLHNADDLTGALEVADACLADATGRGSPMGEATWNHLRGHALAYAGRLDEAEPALRRAFDAREVGWGAWLPVTAGALATVLVERDDLEGAEAVIAEADASSAHPRPSPMWSLTEVARGYLLLERGETDAALLRLHEAAQTGREQLGTDNPALSLARPLGTLALHRGGATADARAAADRDLADAERWGAPRAIGTALRVRALVGPPGERRAMLERSVGVLAASEAGLEHVHSLLALGETLGGTDRTAARPVLRDALAHADRLGARRVARRSWRALVDAGGRPRRHQTTGLRSLTSREREVADLAAAGLTNAAIAGRLFITTKAVAFHLGNVYRKLEVPNRGALPNALRDAPAT